MAKSKEQKILGTLKRFESDIDNKFATSLVNDFLQLSQVLELLKESDRRAFHAFYALVEKNLELELIVEERGQRISKLQRGQTQPKGTGPKVWILLKNKKRSLHAKTIQVKTCPVKICRRQIYLMLFLKIAFSVKLTSEHVKVGLEILKMLTYQVQISRVQN